MRSQAPNTEQPPSGSIYQKKSVFDRLGRQLDANQQMKRRPSPGPYGEYMPGPPVHEPDFSRYPRDPHSQAELEWRYQNDRRLMSFSRDGRHPLPMGPPHQSQPPPPPMGPNHFEMDMGNCRQPPYYPGPNPYHVAPPPGPPPPPLGPGNMPMMMQRSSPKYDRHGNPIVNFKERASSGRLLRMGPMDHQLGMPPRNFMPNEPMMHSGPHDMPLNVRSGNMYPAQRWHEDMDPNFPPIHSPSRMLHEAGFSPVDPRRYGQPMLNAQVPIEHSGPGNDVPKYTKWRERRNVITNLDRETAQSSSRTDSLKSSLQQPDNRIGMKKELQNTESLRSATSSTVKKEKVKARNSVIEELPESANKDLDKASKSAATSKIEPQDISDGEIVDDEDSSDESEIGGVGGGKDSGVAVEHNPFIDDIHYLHRQDIMASHYGRTKDPHQYHEPNKKRRVHKRDDYAMDYETISDEDLDDFMDQQRDFSPKRPEQDILGLDWANLVEIAKQSKTSAKDTAYTPGLALSRFHMPNYLPTLGIAQELAEPELFELIQKLCNHH